VAVAAGLVPVALGTDTGGSVRIPAALNGVSALRPTPGLVPTAGVFPVSWTYDTVGPIARTVAGLAAAARALLPADARDPAAGLHAGVAGLRVGIPTTFFLEDTDAEIVAATHAAVEALRDAGAEIVDVAVPGAERSHAIMRTLITAEAYAVHRRRLAEEPERFGDDVRERLLIGASVRGADYAEAREQARVYAHVALRMFDTCDVVLAPTTGTAAPRIADSETIATTDRLTRATYAWSLAGLPTVAVPAGLTTEGLPIGIQLAAAPGRDALALRAAAAHQAVTAWHTRVPDPV
jgi:aspartyl-tRNA(Asn)/glutamyl-tRNA(Gln) amidotransferase subunit A